MPSSAAARSVSTGKYSSASQRTAYGASSAAANSRAIRWIASCSSVWRKSIVSAVVELRFPLLHESPHPLLLVGGGEHGVEDTALVAEALRQRRLKGAVDRLLGHDGARQRHGCDSLS